MSLIVMDAIVSNLSITAMLPVYYGTSTALHGISTVLYGISTDTDANQKGSEKGGSAGDASSALPQTGNGHLPKPSTSIPKPYS